MTDSDIISDVYSNSSNGVAEMIDLTCFWGSEGAIKKIRRMLSFAIRHHGTPIPNTKVARNIYRVDVDELKRSLCMLDELVEKYKK